MGCITRVVLVAIVLLFACGEPMPPPVTTASTASSSPGPLTAVHEAITCESCHAGQSAEPPADKCLACHQPVREQIATSTGMHGSGPARTKACAVCHHDHKGRSYDIRGWQSMSPRTVFNDR